MIVSLVGSPPCVAAMGIRVYMAVRKLKYKSRFIYHAGAVALVLALIFGAVAYMEFRSLTELTKRLLENEAASLLSLISGTIRSSGASFDAMQEETLRRMDGIAIFLTDLPENSLNSPENLSQIAHKFGVRKIIYLKPDSVPVGLSPSFLGFFVPVITGNVDSVYFGLNEASLIGERRIAAARRAYKGAVLVEDSPGALAEDPPERGRA